jgi:hypothetical protein
MSTQLFEPVPGTLAAMPDDECLAFCRHLDMLSSITARK